MLIQTGEQFFDQHRLRPARLFGIDQVAMFRIRRDKVQRIPVMWIPSTNRTIPVGSLPERDLDTALGNPDSDRLTRIKRNHQLSFDDAILLKNG